MLVANKMNKIATILFLSIICLAICNCTIIDMRQRDPSSEETYVPCLGKRNAEVDSTISDKYQGRKIKKVIITNQLMK